MGPGSGAVATADAYSERHFGGKTFAAFDPRAHGAAAAALHDHLVRIGFGPDRAAALFGLDEISDVRASRAAYFDAFALPHDAAGRAARFFVLHQPEPEGDLRAWLGDAAVDLLVEMAAIVTIAGLRRSLVSATWFAGCLIFADARAYNAVRRLCDAAGRRFPWPRARCAAHAAARNARRLLWRRGADAGRGSV
jgi:hypothetical protein